MRIIPNLYRPVRGLFSSLRADCCPASAHLLPTGRRVGGVRELKLDRSGLIVDAINNPDQEYDTAQLNIIN